MYTNTKYFAAAVPAIVAAAALLAGCVGSGRNSDTAAEINDFEVDQVIKSAARSYRGMLYGDTVYLTLSATVQWPERFGEYDIVTLRRHILAEAFADTVGTGDVDAAIRRFIDNTSVVDADTVGTDDGGEGLFSDVEVVSAPAPGIDCYEVTVSARLTMLSEQMVSYDVLTSSYLGGAHPNYASTPFTYVFELGQIVTYDTLFKEGTGEAVSEALNRAAADQYGTRPYRLTRKSFFSDTLAVSHEVSISGSSVVFHYNPYDVAPYSEGMIDVEVPAFMLADCLTDPYRRLLDDEADE